MKLDMYYRTLRDSPVSYAAVALPPGFGWGFFEERWGEDHPAWVEEAKEAVQWLWDTKYRNIGISRSRYQQKWVQW
ncbi:hypothetical protein BFJ69_g15994 [Fusarium oxysporum]|uniref:Uncharacterized protein n=1 Tax=Fusarium oxysporum TaxID=5507 RepID=A0A420NE98_FUSOX|nr:hypothetical protein BFJ69_g15994 [Fusarium oxysporum]RKK78588.1 hypothetical protein BFJ71_g16447 [Fusarium oxysporum]